MFPSLGQLVDVSDSEKSFISVAALIAKRKGGCGVQFRGKQPRA